VISIVSKSLQVIIIHVTILLSEEGSLGNYIYPELELADSTISIVSVVNYAIEATTNFSG
jgi:hypothetical protein